MGGQISGNTSDMELGERAHDKLAHRIKHDYKLSRVNESVN